LASVFGDSAEVNLSRGDLRRLATKSDLAEFVVATIVWGYPRGMRGNNVRNMFSHFTPLCDLLSGVRAAPVTNWDSHFDDEVHRIEGLGLSTYTKFLQFLDARIEGNAALILDKRIIDTCNTRVFEELAPLRNLTLTNAPGSYTDNLACMRQIASNLSVKSENIEFFLFEFGLNLKAT
jgi:8-oxoguanine DNA glycosylase-like protein